LWECVALGEPGDVVHRAGAAGLDQSMVGIDRFGRVGRRDCRIVEQQHSVVIHREPIGFETEQIIGVAVEDGLCGVALAMDGVGRHGRALRWRSWRSARRAAISPSPCGTPDLTERKAAGAGEGIDERQWRAAPRPLKRAAQAFAIDRHHPGISGGARQPCVKRSRQPAKASGLNEPEHSSFERANSSKSTELSGPHRVAVSAIVSGSRRSCRCAFPRPGSGKSPKQSVNQPIGFPQRRNRQQNPVRPDPQQFKKFKCDSPALSRVPGLRHCLLPQTAAEPIGTSVSAIFFGGSDRRVVILRFAWSRRSHVRHSGPGSGALLHICVAGRGLPTRLFHSLFPNCNASLSQLQAVGELPD